MARPKKIKVEDMQVADGEKIVTETKAPRSIYDILGKKNHKYRTTDLEEYKNYIKSLGTTELQVHAYECSILPIDNRAQLMERLIREFCSQTNGYSVSAVRRESFQELHDSPEKLAEVKRILSRGK